MTGRAEDWGACCEHRALQLDRLIEERMAGMGDAAAAIEAVLLALYERTGDRGVLEGVSAVREWAVKAAVRAVGATEPLPEGSGHPGHPSGDLPPG